MQLSLFASRHRLLGLSCIAIVMTVIHVYWLLAFFEYGPYTLTAPDTMWPDITRPKSLQFIHNILAIIVLTQLINWLILHWIVIWMAFRLRSDWEKIPWYGRMMYSTVLLVAIPVIATMWSPLGQEIYMWIID